MGSSVRLPSRTCTNTPGIMAPSGQTLTSRSGSAYGSGLSSAASTTEKIAALAPMPNASVDRRVIARNDGRRDSARARSAHPAAAPPTSPRDARARRVRDRSPRSRRARRAGRRTRGAACASACLTRQARAPSARRLRVSTWNVELVVDLTLDRAHAPPAGAAVFEFRIPVSCASLLACSRRGAQHLEHRLGVRRPARRLGAELRSAPRRELVVLRLAVVLRESPFRLDPAAILESMQRDVECAILDVQRLVRRLADPRRDGVAVSRRRRRAP